MNTSTVCRNGYLDSLSQYVIDSITVCRNECLCERINVNKMDQDKFYEMLTKLTTVEGFAHEQTDLHEKCPPSEKDEINDFSELDDFREINAMARRFPPTTWEHYIQYILPIFFTAKDPIKPINRDATHKFEMGEILSYKPRYSGLEILLSFINERREYGRVMPKLTIPETKFPLVVQRTDSGRYIIIYASNPLLGNDVMIYVSTKGRICMQNISDTPYVWCDIKNVLEIGEDEYLSFSYVGHEGCGPVCDLKNSAYLADDGVTFYTNTVIRNK